MNETKVAAEGQSKPAKQFTRIPKNGAAVREAMVKRYPEHVVDLSMIIMNNAEIRRFTALGIINYLLQKGEIKGKKRFVKFWYNKFTVKCDGLAREYFYTEPFFLNALVASFSSFSASAQRVIDNFTKKELEKNISEAIDTNEVEILVEACLENSDEEVVAESAQ